MTDKIEQIIASATNQIELSLLARNTNKMHYAGIIRQAIKDAIAYYESLYQ